MLKLSQQQTKRQCMLTIKKKIETKLEIYSFVQTTQRNVGNPKVDCS